MGEKRSQTKPLLISIKRVMDLTSMSKSGIYKQISMGKFPHPKKTPGIRRVFWVEHEVLDWIQAVRETPGW
ncbi:MAG TPA: AlpA family phage regulatory protein [Magnetococcales bacterium]|nr:AlpA family phage regulatory protein [Magnetococcales bacterium]